MDEEVGVGEVALQTWRDLHWSDLHWSDRYWSEWHWCCWCCGRCGRCRHYCRWRRGCGTLASSIGKHDWSEFAWEVPPQAHEQNNRYVCGDWKIQEVCRSPVNCGNDQTDLLLTMRAGRGHRFAEATRNFRYLRVARRLDLRCLFVRRLLKS
jgi:hypothetical protein